MRSLTASHVRAMPCIPYVMPHVSKRSGLNFIWYSGRAAVGMQGSSPRWHIMCRNSAPGAFEEKACWESQGTPAILDCCQSGCISLGL